MGEGLLTAAAWVDGRPAQTVPLSDRGLQFGDGLFETLAVVEGRPSLWQAHMKRLSAGARQLRLPPPNTSLLREEAERLCQGLAAATLKVYWTAGDSPRGYARRRTAAPRRILQVFDNPAGHRRPTDDWDLALCRHRWSENPGLAGIKHLNRLDQVLAREELHGSGCDEGLMLGQDDRVVSGTMSNLFVQCDDVLLTPELHSAGIRGIVRELVLACARRAGLAVAECRVDLADIRRADALYLCNSLVGIARARRFDDTLLPTDTALHPAIRRARALVHDPAAEWPA
jgi:4-amino-4-deoxychorismate lyase